MTEAVHVLYGGSFDPVHIGHLRLALECQAQLAPCQFEFVPAFQAPLKNAAHATAAQRLAMLQLAVAELNEATGSNAFSVNTWELQQGALCYTVDTLAAFRANAPLARVFWLLGQDSWQQLHRWHHWQRLTDYAHLLVVNRPEVNAGEAPEVAEFAHSRRQQLDQVKGTAGAVCFAHTTPLNVSSSHLRSLLAGAGNPAYLVSAKVAQYIQQHHLYQ